jgi:hypothetical protein
VETANTSHSSGDLKFCQIALALGTGARNQANQTRPTWKAGKMPAHITAKIVIASAARLIEVRQFWRVRKRIAEIRVPAWPIPIQNTKLTIGQPHITRLVFPQTPTPVETRWNKPPPTPMAAISADGMNSSHQSSGWRFSSTPQIRSVIQW